MIQVKCTQKFKNAQGRIYGYRLQDAQGNIRDVYSDPLKKAIRNKQITVVNLKLTSDNRLVDTSEKQQTSIIEQQIQAIIDKAKLLGIQIKEIRTYCNHKCYLISMSDTQHIVCIPDDVTKLNLDKECLTFTRRINDLQGTLKIIGGHNLQDTEYMFYKCQAQSLDLSSFDTSSVRCMYRMFYLCEAKYIELSSLDTSNVTSMEEMFNGCEAQSLDLSSFDTSKVTDMSVMFYRCLAESINLSSFNTSNVISMHQMFSACHVQSLDLSSFNTSKVKDMNWMFSACKAKYIDLSSFDTPKIEYISCMFYEYQAQIKATDPKILAAYNNR